MAGQPTKHDALTEICQHIAIGLPRKHACAMAGVHDSTLRRWILDEKEKGDRSPYAGTLVALERAEAVFIGTATAHVLANMATEPGLALKVLERRAPQDWAPTQRIAGHDGGAVELNIAANARAAEDLLARFGRGPVEA